jgi:methionine-rich copper-binding protein CopC
VKAFLVRAAVVGGLVLAASGLAAGTASAHAQLLLTDPANGAQLAGVPKVVTLTFNQPVLAIGSVLEVVGPGGNMAVGKPSLVDREVHQAVRPGAPGGSYTVLWRVTSVDGHPISGQFGFGTGGAAAGAGSTAGGADGSASTDVGSQQSPGENSGSGISVLWLLVGGAASVIVAATLLALRWRGPTLAADEVRAGRGSDGGRPTGGYVDG